MPFWKKKKERDPFEGMFPDFNKIQEMMDEMMKRAFTDEPFAEFEELRKKAKPGQPMVYGFSFTLGPDGKPKIEEFGNIEPGRQPGVKEEREPLVDVMDKPREITVLAELPGVEKKDIQVNVMGEDNVLHIYVPNKFNKRLKLPTKVKPEHTKAQYKNGVLEVNLVKAEEPPVKGGVRVE